MQNNKNLQNQLILYAISLGVLIIAIALFIANYQNSQIEAGNMMRYFFNLKTFIIIGIFLALFFLVIREIVTWYWKINHIVSLLEKIEKNTSRQENTKEHSQS